MNWQPIETAPKDGTRLLLVWPGGEPIIGHWQAGSEAWSMGEDFEFEAEPANWMPLPEPPEAAPPDGFSIKGCYVGDAPVGNVFSSPSNRALLFDGSGRKLDLRIDMIGGNCPVQAEGTVNGTPFYFRARHEHWSFGVGSDPIGAPGWQLEEAWGDGPLDAGWMPVEVARGKILHAAYLWLKSRHPD